MSFIPRYQPFGPAAPKPYHLVLWFGGLDSTYLVRSLLQAGKRVKPVYVRIQNNGDRHDIELRAVRQIAALFADEFPGLLYEPQEVLSLSVTAPASAPMFVQMPLWLLGLLLSLSPTDQDPCRGVYIGYVMSDQGLSMLPELRKVWKAYEGLCYEALPPLRFPLRKKCKSEIWYALPEAVRKLLIWCEMPRLVDSSRPRFRFKGDKHWNALPVTDKEAGRLVQCGECVPCKRAIAEGIMEALPLDSRTQEAMRIGFEVLDAQEKAQATQKRTAEVDEPGKLIQGGPGREVRKRRSPTPDKPESGTVQWDVHH